MRPDGQGRSGAVREPGLQRPGPDRAAPIDGFGRLGGGPINQWKIEERTL
jgi:hypothetical protein